MTAIHFVEITEKTQLQFPANRQDQIQQIGLLDEAELDGYISKDLLNIAEELGPTYRDQKYRALRLYEASA
ncbi:hypothetical protein QFC19_000688 [Naganishia cerealis]|uniref:Uncharacterized protein n=1 Tax=Naganishia cerealis TaxID=610337 RepID=A0ACC2WKK3_9TREE|nr:hypothetical protein QFC19_000688 [Naganishia cerealis]